MRTSACVVILVTCGLMVLLAGFGLAAAPSPGETSFRVSGTIVDQNGRPMTHARLSIRESRVVDLKNLKSDYRTYAKDVEGRFDLRVGPCYGGEIRIEAEGYFPERVKLTQSDREGRERAASSWSNLKVVMTPAPVPAKLHEFHVLYNSRDAVVEEEPRKERPLWNTEDWQRWFTSRLQVAAPRDENGAFLLVTRKGTGRSGWRYKVPQQMEVTLGVNAGVLRFRPASDRRCNRQMLMAPESGYEPILLLKADEIGQDVRVPVYAYFQVDGLFGRLAIHDVNLDPAVNRLNARFVVQLQPDGSRNLCFLKEPFGAFDAGNDDDWTAE